MVRRRSTVRFRKGALAHRLGRRCITCANSVQPCPRVLRLATAEPGLLRLVVPNTCPTLAPGSQGASIRAAVATAAGAVKPVAKVSHRGRELFTASWAPCDAQTPFAQVAQVFGTHG